MTRTIRDKAIRTYVWPTGDVIALFPREAATPGHCMSYEHVGQHGAADYSGCVRMTRPAKPEEYRDLQCELERIGYKLDVRKRA